MRLTYSAQVFTYDKNRKDNQLQSLELPVEYPSLEYKFNIKSRWQRF